MEMESSFSSMQVIVEVNELLLNIVPVIMFFFLNLHRKKMLHVIFIM